MATHDSPILRIRRGKPGGGGWGDTQTNLSPLEQERE